MPDKPLVVQSSDNKDISMNFKTVVFGILLIVGLVLGGLFIWDIGRKDALTEYRKELATYKSMVVTPVLKSVDSMSVIAKIAVDSSTKLAELNATNTRKLESLQSTSNTLRSRNTKLMDSLKSLSPTDSNTHKLYVVVVDSLLEEIDTLNVRIVGLENRDSIRVQEIGQLKYALFLKTTSSDSLQKVIINWPKPPAPEKLFALNITKKQAFIVGVVTGVAGSIVIVKGFQK